MLKIDFTHASFLFNHGSPIQIMVLGKHFCDDSIKNMLQNLFDGQRGLDYVICNMIASPHAKG